MTVTTRTINKNKFYRTIGKRGLDIFLVLLFAVPAGILVALAALAIRLDTKERAFFTQIRPGLNAKPYRLYKLRSMVSETERDGKPLSDMERVTKTGKIIRVLSLDELPQLLNILKGDMSFIGPRPLLMQYVPLYSNEQARRHDVRPGVSGWAQVNGRNAISWDEKFALDTWYAAHVSLKLDAKIFWMTLVNILKRKDVNAGAEVTMELFQGNGKEGNNE